MLAGWVWVPSRLLLKQAPLPEAANRLLVTGVTSCLGHGWGVMAVQADLIHLRHHVFTHAVVLVALWPCNPVDLISHLSSLGMVFSRGQSTCSFRDLNMPPSPVAFHGDQAGSRDLAQCTYSHHSGCSNATVLCIFYVVGPWGANRLVEHVFWRQLIGPGQDFVLLLPAMWDDIGLELRNLHCLCGMYC